MSNELITEAVTALQKAGDACTTWRWLEGDPDYVAGYALTAEHIPALIALATEWVEDRPDDDTLFGPVHAWRALGQLRAVEAVQPLLDMQDELDEVGDDWYLEEFDHVFGLIGPPAIEPLAAYLADESHGEFPRVKAASGLQEIARRFPETRERVVALLSGALARHQDATFLNGSLVAELLDLKAVESAEVIERAFAANVIDPTIAGDWDYVRQELGVPGLGIAPDHSPGWLSIRERLGFVDPVAEQQRRAASEKHRLAREHKKLQDAKRSAKAKRKQKKRDRKRNRKPR
jgi:hypothetical protein